MATKPPTRKLADYFRVIKHSFLEHSPHIVRRLSHPPGIFLHFGGSPSLPRWHWSWWIWDNLMYSDVNPGWKWTSPVLLIIRGEPLTKCDTIIFFFGRSLQFFDPSGATQSYSVYSGLTCLHLKIPTSALLHNLPFPKPSVNPKHIQKSPFRSKLMDKTWDTPRQKKCFDRLSYLSSVHHPVFQASQASPNIFPREIPSDVTVTVDPCDRYGANGSSSAESSVCKNKTYIATYHIKSPSVSQIHGRISACTFMCHLRFGVGQILAKTPQKMDGFLPDMMNSPCGMKRLDLSRILWLLWNTQWCIHHLCLFHMFGDFWWFNPQFRLCQKSLCLVILQKRFCRSNLMLEVNFPCLLL